MSISRLSITWLLLSAAARANSPVAVDRDGLQAQLARATAEVGQAQSMVQRNANRNEIANLLGAALQELGQLQGQLQAAAPLAPAPVAQAAIPAVYPSASYIAPPYPATATAPIPAPAPVPIDDHSFGNLVRAVRDQNTSPATQVSLVASAARGSNFLVWQAVKLIQQIDGIFFAGKQLEMLAQLSPRLLDKQNAFQIYPLFARQRDRQRAQQIVEGR